MKIHTGKEHEEEEEGKHKEESRLANDGVHGAKKMNRNRERNEPLLKGQGRTSMNEDN